MIALRERRTQPMSKINRSEFIAEMIKGYKEDSASALSSTESIEVETASETADNIEDKMTANLSNNVSRETPNNTIEEKGELNNESN